MTKLKLHSLFVCSLFLAACTQSGGTSSSAHITPSASVPQVVLPATTEDPTALAPTEATTTSLSTSDTPVPTSAITNPALAIHSFEIVSIEDLAQGKRFTFRWSASGESARIISGTQRRFAYWWQVPLEGTLTVEIPGTLYRDPSIALVVSNGLEDSLTQSIQVEWACRDQYFFIPETSLCPRAAVTHTFAAEQRFEHGRMFWLESEKMIVVLYDESPNSTLFRFEDTWAAGQPESDPTLLSPPGLYQPVRGFGKVWREGFEVRQRLGWALTREQGYEARFQSASNESIGGTFYLSTIDGQVLKLQGYDVGSGVWELLPSAVVVQ